MSDHKFILEIADDGQTATVAVKGAVGIEDAHLFRETLADAIEKAKTVCLDLSGVTGIDTTPVQVICSACRTATERAANFALHGDVPDCIQTLEQNLGIRMGAPCRHKNNRPCLVFRGGS